MSEEVRGNDRELQFDFMIKHRTVKGFEATITNDDVGAVPAPVPDLQFALAMAHKNKY